MVTSIPVRQEQKRTRWLECLYHVWEVGYMARVTRWSQISLRQIQTVSTELDTGKYQSPMLYMQQRSQRRVGKVRSVSKGKVRLQNETLSRHRKASDSKPKLRGDGRTNQVVQAFAEGNEPSSVEKKVMAYYKSLRKRRIRYARSRGLI